MMHFAFVRPGNPPFVDCEACGLPVAPVAHVIRGGGDPNKNYMRVVCDGKLLREKAAEEALIAGLANVVCPDCVNPLATLKARIFARRARKCQ